jgi:hypothetical protein
MLHASKISLAFFASFDRELPTYFLICMSALFMLVFFTLTLFGAAEDCPFAAF